ncbi:ferrichrome-iron receptor precursor [mine drainage metagenome]|uniref:Ferrichrome-iron receptor n=1 Tax=mine drainage metagenome TaxID=410659 RepID=A0A1J5R3P9_9ZZZZ
MSRNQTAIQKVIPIVAVLLAGGSAVFGQTAPAASSPTDKSNDQVTKTKDDVILLDPFVVNAESSNGYVATSTLAGTRLNTDLRDLGSAVTVVTGKLLSDLGATDNLTLLQYTPGTEVAGSHGNYGGQSSVNGGNDLLRDPNSGNRVRGLDSADNTRNFFMTQIPWDDYNVDRVDLSRGPNSLLFGIGSPAGLVNATLKSAIFRKKGSVDFVYDSNGSKRETFDVNQPILANELALRFDGLHTDSKYEQVPAFERQNRLYGTMTYSPKALNRNGNQTSISASFEGGNITANRERSDPPLDNISAWYLYGRNNTVAATNPAVDGNGYWNPFYWGDTNHFPPWLFRGYSTGYFGAPLFGNSNGNATLMPIQGTILPSAATKAMFTYNASGVPQGLINDNIYTQGQNLTAYRLNNNLVPYSSLQYANAQITDPGIFDFYHQLIDGSNNRQWSNWSSQSLNLKEILWNGRAGFSGDYYHEKYTDGELSLYQNAIQVETNSFLLGPGGATAQTQGYSNQNVGRPYVAGDGYENDNLSHYERQTMRAQAFGELRPTEIWGRSWITSLVGKQLLTLVASQQSLKQEDIAFERFAYSDVTAQQVWGDSNPWLGADNNRRVEVNTYIGAPMSSASSLSSLHLSNVQQYSVPGTQTVNVPVFNYTWINPGVSPTAPWVNTTNPVNAGKTETQTDNPANYQGWTMTPADIVSIGNNPNASSFSGLAMSGTKSHNYVNSEVASWQGKFLQDNLVVLFGIRRDEATYFKTYAPTPTSANPLNGDGAAGLNAPTYTWDDTTYTPRSTVTGTSKTTSVALHLPASIASKLPYGITPSLLYVQSSNFKPEPGRFDVYGNQLASPLGRTQEVSLLVEALDGKFSVRIGHYKTVIKNSDSPALNVWFGNGLYDWGQYYANGLISKANTDPSSVDPRALAAAKYWVANVGQVYTPAMLKFWDIPVAGEQYGTDGHINSAATSQDTEGTGYELEMTFQPTKNLSLIVNGSHESAKFTNIGGATFDWYNKVSSFLNTNTDPSHPGWVVGDLPLWGGTGVGNANYSTNGYHEDPGSNWSYVGSVWFYNNESGTAGQVANASARVGQQVMQMRPDHLNLIANYTFDSGRLKGLNFGGAFRWSSAAILGYRGAQNASYTPTNGQSQYVYDLNSPIKGPSERHFDLWVGYERNLMHNMKYRIQLNLQSVGEHDRLLPSYANPDGTYGYYYIQQGMTWRLSNTISF